MTRSVSDLAVRSDCWGRIRYCWGRNKNTPQGDEVRGPGTGDRRQARPGLHFGGNDEREVGRVEYLAPPHTCKQGLTTCWIGFDYIDSPLPK